MKPILLFDFDGVIHSYKSGWKGPAIIPDPPVPGAIEFLAEVIGSKIYDVCIYSARSSQRGGINAMKEWISEHFQRAAANNVPECIRLINCTPFAGPWYKEVNYATKKLIKAIRFPKKKPGAFLTIDDRAICFDGDYSSLMEKIKTFKPWSKKPV
jgi:hypothetical protein